jgi:hypothetical protein
VNLPKGLAGLAAATVNWPKPFVPAVGAAILLVGGVVAPAAHAAPAKPTDVRDRLDACFTGACGSATFTFKSNGTQATNVDMSVKDNKCDSHPVYLRFRVYEGDGGYWRTGKRWNSSGCDANYAEWHNKHINAEWRIYALRVEVCVDDAGTDTCRASSPAYNPYF